MVLERAQQLGLQRRRELADLVEEHRAAVGDLEPPLLERDGAGEGAFFVTEELALEQRLGQRGAVHGDKRAPRARTILVNRPGSDFLSRAGFAKHQNRAVGWRDFPDALVDGAHRRSLTHHVVGLERNPACEHLCHDRHRRLGFRVRSPRKRSRHARRSILDCPLGQGLAGRTCLMPAWEIQEQQHRIADTDAVAVLQGSLTRRDAVDEGSIRTAEVAQNKAAVDCLDLAVAPRHQPVGDAELSCRVTADGYAKAFYRKCLTAKWAGKDYEFAAHGDTMAVQAKGLPSFDNCVGASGTIN